MSIFKFSQSEKSSIGLILLSSCSVCLNVYNFIKLKEVKSQRTKDHKQIDYLKTRLAMYESQKMVENDELQTLDSSRSDEILKSQFKCKSCETFIKEERDGLNN